MSAPLQQAHAIDRSSSCVNKKKERGATDLSPTLCLYCLVF